MVFWLGNFYLWYAVIGAAFVPLGLYFTALVKSVFVTNGTEHGPHAEQVGIVVMIYAWILSAIFIYPAYCVFGPSMWLKNFFLGYIAWYATLDRKTASSGKRFARWSRRLPFWRILAEYFPVRLHVSAKLDPSGNYLFGYHPHGVIGVGALLTFATEATGFYEAFPGLDLRLLTLSMNFKFPFTREVLMGLGINSVTKSSVETNLTRAPGASVAIVIGGASEALDARPGWATLTLARRKGFVKMALRTGASLVPVFAFGASSGGAFVADGGAAPRFEGCTFTGNSATAGCPCSSAKLSDDRCDAECSIRACAWDYMGSCCPPACELGWGDGSCVAVCNTAACGYDGGEYTARWRAPRSLCRRKKCARSV